MGKRVIRELPKSVAIAARGAGRGGGYLRLKKKVQQRDPEIIKIFVLQLVHHPSTYCACLLKGHISPMLGRAIVGLA